MLLLVTLLLSVTVVQIKRSVGEEEGIAPRESLVTSLTAHFLLSGASWEK